MLVFTLVIVNYATIIVRRGYMAVPKLSSLLAPYIGMGSTRSHIYTVEHGYRKGLHPLTFYPHPRHVGQSGYRKQGLYLK